MNLLCYLLPFFTTSILSVVSNNQDSQESAHFSDNICYNSSLEGKVYKLATLRF